MRIFVLLSGVAFLSSSLPAQGRNNGYPKRDIDDPGVIATGQRISPAGVQSVFEGRVAAVKFGAGASELWVAAPGGIQKMSWRDGVLLARGAFDGRPGVQGMAVDPVSGRAFVASIGRTKVATSRLPGTSERPEDRTGVRLLGFDPGGTPSSQPTIASSTLGAFLAGSPAIAMRANASGHRVVVLPMTADDKLAILDADSAALLGSVSLGVVPVAAVVTADGSIAYVTNAGGSKPGKGERSAAQCCDSRAERVRVDERGIASRGSVMRVDLVARKVTATLQVGRHPTALAFDESRNRLYVAEGNDDAVTIIDTRSSATVAQIEIAPFRGRTRGLAPTALALSPDRQTLYIALGGANAVAVYDLRSPQPTLRGLIPTAWYPASLDVSADGQRIAVGALLGVGSGTGETGGSPGKTGRYVHAVRGSASVVEVPNDAQLAAYTTAVAQNNRLTLRADAAPANALARVGTAPRAIPERVGEPSVIKHVVFIVKENRTYDQVLGDLERGNGDSSLVIYGRDVTPNQHKLAEEFVTLDHFFASGGNSADGHQWITQANETEYPMWPLYYGRSYPSEGNDPLAYSAGGFLWEAAQARGRRVVVFGEYAPAPSDSLPRVRADLLARWQSTAPADRPSAMRALMKTRYNTHSAIPSLDKTLVREYPGWTQEVPDVVKAEVFLSHLNDWEKTGRMPDLSLMILPSNHTVGTTPGWCRPRACVADNDLALGKIVDGLSHSRFWKDMVILVVEDDAQNGVDHIDGHRTLAFAISPYTKRGSVDSTFYTHPSMVKTVELILGLPALSMFDLVATDMRASFLDAGAVPDLAPYTAAEAIIALDETNVKLGAITGPNARERRLAAVESSRMRLDIPDAAPSEKLNRILWHDARGWEARYPAIKRSLYFPLAVDVDDDDREVRAIKR